MSTLRTNALEGVDAKNSITIVAGAGNVTTTNIEQGLTKAWADFSTSSGNSINGSFNIGSITDIGTGDVYLNYTNNMNDVHYSGQANATAATLHFVDDQATNRQRCRAYSDFSTETDGAHRYFLCAGDLA